MDCYDDYSDLQLDVFREIGSIGAGNAATALSSLLGNKVSISVPVLQIINVNDICKILGGPEKQIVGILVKMTHDIRGILLFLLDFDSAKMLIGALLSSAPDCLLNLSEIDKSALIEVANILAGSYISSICSFTNLDIRLLSPQLSIDMVGAILNYPAAMFGTISDKLLFIEGALYTENRPLKSHLLIMPDGKSLDLMLNKLGVS